jgi:PKD repeat protein
MKRFIPIFICLLVSWVGMLQEVFAQTLVMPKDAWVQADTLVAFQWNPCIDADYYELQVATQADYSDAITEQIYTTDTTLILFGSTYYWRVRCSIDTEFSSWSYLRTFSIIDLSSMGDLVLWLDASDGVDTLLGGKVERWHDKSGNGYDLEQLVSSRQPSLNTSLSKLNSKSVVRFDGIDDFISVDFGQTYEQPNTVIIVWDMESTSGNRYVLSGIGQFGSHSIYWRAASQTINLHSGSSFVQAYSKSIPFDYILTTINFNGVNTSVYENSELRNIVNAGEGVLGGVMLGCEYTVSNFHGGNVAEILIYEDELTQEEQLMVEDYLRLKYAPPVNLSGDIYADYGFCDTVLVAEQAWFTDYLWSTGETTSSIEVSPGTYWVEVTDIFGFTSRDTVSYYPPGNFSFQDTLLCLGDSLEVNTQLTGDYTFVWSNGASTSSIFISAADDYQVTVTDTNSCAFSSDWFSVEVDSFKTHVSLGGDTTLCSGNSIALVSGGDLVTDYLWNTSETTSSIAVTASGEYSVAVSSATGCMAYDTIQVTILGLAPTVDFGADTVCLGSPTVFTNLSEVDDPEEISDYAWDFGLDTSVEEHPEYLFPDTGAYEVSLEVNTTAGCSNTQVKSVYVRPNPEAKFSLGKDACIDNGYHFESESTPPVGDPLAMMNWEFGNGDDATGMEVSYTYTASGDYEVLHWVETEAGCRDSLELLLTVVSEAPLVNVPSLVFPAQDYVTASDSMTFIWSTVPGALSYDFILASDEAFTQIVMEETGLQTTTLHINNLNEGSYYWKVRGYNICGEATESTVRTFSILDLSSMGDLVLWLDASDGVDTLLGGKVERWHDKSGNGYDLEQLVSSRQPSLNTSLSKLNSKSVVRFDGIDDFISVDFGQTYEQPNTVIIVWDMESTSGNRYVLSGIGQFGSHSIYWRAASQTINLHSGSSFVQAYSKSIPFDYILTTINFNGVNTSVYENSELRNIVNAGEGVLGGVMLGCEYTVSNFHGGNVAEILIYEDELTQEEQLMVEDYLRLKYAPPVNLSGDIYADYGFCDTVLVAEQAWFTDYLWSTGETTSSIEVSPGTYWVEVTDIFGFTSRDTVSYYPPGNFSFQDTLLCLGDSLEVNTQLTGDYTFVWSNGASTSSIFISAADDYQVTVTDTNSCAFSSDWFSVEVDSFKTHVSLGGDTTLCSGNSIALVSGGDLVTDYLWNTSETTSSIAVTASGEYSVAVSSATGCMAYDTIQVTILGLAPTVDFGADTVCLGSPTVFTNLSEVDDPEEISDYAWDFGLDTSVEEHPEYLFPDTGAYEVSLEVNTTAGCSNTQVKSVYVRPNPEAKFSLGKDACIDNGYHFESESTPPVGDPLAMMNWEFGNGDDATGMEVSYTYTASGDYEVLHWVETEAGCRDSLELLLTVVSEAPLVNVPSLVFPAQDYVTASDSMTFIWSTVPGALSYDFILASDEAFTQIVMEETGLQTTTLHINNLNEGSYYWKVRGYNICGEATESTVRTFSILDLSSMGDLVLWLDASDGVDTLLGGKVERWHDKSGNGYDLEQLVSSRQPSLNTSLSKLNSKSVVRFDGIDDFISVDFGQTYEQPNTVIIVWDMESTSGNRYVLSGITDQESHSLFWRAASEEIGIHTNTFYTPAYAKPIPFDYMISTVKYNGSISEVYENGELKNTVNGGVGELGGLKLGSAFNNSSFFGGNVAEILIYENEITQEKQLTVEDYLINKYTPPFTLGPDIYINYGVCDTTLSIPELFSEVLWSTGDTLHTLSVQDAGTYWVQGRDIFGRMHYDTVQVFKPQPVSAPETFIFCSGDTIVWDIGLSGAYSFSWNNGDTEAALAIHQPGDYAFVVTDTLGCSYASDTLTIVEDDFYLTYLLPEDTAFCQGGTIQSDTINTSFTYLWSTGNTDASLVIMNSDTYYLQVTNFNGCLAEDSVQVTITGVDPELSVQVIDPCVNTPLFFDNTSQPSLGDAFTFWEWNFSDGQFSGEFSPELSFPDTGLYSGTLYTETQDGCMRELNIEFEVLPKPQADFTVSGTSCSGQEMSFEDQSFSIANLAAWNWDFDDPNEPEGATTPNATHTFIEKGEYWVELRVTDTNNCSDTTTTLVNIFPTPVASFTAEDDCRGEEIPFVNTSTVDAPYFIAASSWKFGDGNESTLTNPKNSYSLDGEYEVELTVIASNNCIHSTSSTITIHPLPVANFTVDGFCAEIPVTFSDNSVISSGNLTTFDWIIAGQNKSGNPVTHIFETIGQKVITLTVGSEYGCTDFTTNTIEITPTPTALFSIFPNLQVVSQPVVFDNQSQGSSDYFWDFGDGTTSTEQHPEHAYNAQWLDSIVEVSLVVGNTFSCTDTFKLSFKLYEPVLDLAVTNVFVNNQDGYLSIAAELFNFGTTVITEGEFTLGVNANNRIKEYFEAEILSGKSIVYELRTSPAGFTTYENQNSRFVCVEAKAFSDLGLIDIRPENDEFCLNLMDDEPIIISPYPNPFDETVTVAIILPSTAPTELYLADNFGKIIHVINPGSDLSEGLHTFTLSLPDLVGGQYFIILDFKGKRVVSKVVKGR